MEKRIAVILIFIFEFCYLCAQITAESLLAALPPVPGNVCTASSESRLNFTIAIREVEKVLEQMQLDEKEAGSAEEERCGFNQSLLQDESLGRKFEALMAEFAKLQEQVHNDYMPGIQNRIEIEAPLENEYSEKMYELTSEFWEIRRNEGNVEPVRKKIRSLLKVKCEILSEIRLKSIQDAYSLLLKQWTAFEKMNSLQDEANRISFTGYTLSLKDGGFLLDGIKYYIGELQTAYQWNPEEAVMDELDSIGDNF